MRNFYKMTVQIQKYSTANSTPPTLFMEVLENVYPNDAILKSKQSESINLQYSLFFLIACINSKPVGRMIVYKNQYHLINEKQAITIGYLEAIPDEEVWEKLVNEVQSIAKDENVTSIIGPMNGSTWEQYRLTEPSENPLFLSEPFYPTYYSEYLQKQGFTVLAKYISNADRVMDWRKERIIKKEEDLRKILTIRPIDIENLKEELENIYPLVTEAFEDNFLYSPINKSIFTEKYLKLKSIITPEMVLVAEDKETGERAGFIFAFPDLFNTTEKGFIIKTLARNKKSKYAGIGSVLSNIVTKYAKENGYTYCIHAFMIQSNSSTLLSITFTGEPLKKHHLFIKECSYA